MTRIQWDQKGERRFETGVDRGVLFLLDGTAVPWNGLTLVGESIDQEVKSYYLDGIKYLDHHVSGSYSSRIQAFTYPDELDHLTGVSPFIAGVFLHDQNAKLFNLSYRTLIGNDVQGLDHGYKLHLLYNLLAVPADAEFESVKETIEPRSFEWTLTGTPPQMVGARPTNHISIDSRLVNQTALQTFENTLYGTSVSDPRLPRLVDVLTFFELAGPPPPPLPGGDGNVVIS